MELVSRLYSIKSQLMKLIEKHLRDHSCSLIEVFSWHLPGGTKENHDNPVRIVCFPGKILTEHLPNSPEHYHFANKASMQQPSVIRA
jgi:hypothetical protein